MSDKPLVSIIIPTLNVAGTIRKCLQSCVCQTYLNIEIIVNDGNKNGPSTDGTMEIIKEFAGIKLIFDNRGVAQARNAGNKLAQGFYVFHIDSDMELSPDLIEKAVLTAEEGNYDVLIVPEVSVGETFWAKCRALERRMFHGDKFQERANRFMKREVFEAMGGMDENLWGGEDSDLSLRIKKSDYKIGRIGSVIFHHEPTSFIITLRKYYRYGKTFPSWLKKNNKSDFAKQFFPSYLFTKRNLKLLAGDPVHALGFIFLKSIIYIVSVYGLTAGYIVKIFPPYSDQLDERLTARLEKSILWCGDMREKRILDIGCSNGLMEELIYTKEKDYKEIIGIDPTIGQKQLPDLPRVVFKNGSALDILEPDASFDKVIMFEVLEHLPRGSEEQALQEIRRVLKPGGELIFSTQNYKNFFLSQLLDPLWIIFGHRHYKLDFIIKLFEKNNFQIESAEIGGGLYEAFSQWIFYPFRLIGREIPFKNFVEKKKHEEFFSSQKGFVSMLIKCQKL
jgi:glycosyltransferase involved in cell wall biosynthesis